MQLNRTPNALTKTDRENMNKNWTALEEEINRLGPAPALAELAKRAAEQANAKTENVQKQLNNLVVEGDSSPQATQASVGADGTDYDGNLKARLDAEHNTVTAQLAEKARQSDLEIERARISTLVANAGNTDGNAELLDARIGFDGKTYPTVGEAVRALSNYMIEENEPWEVE